MPIAPIKVKLNNFLILIFQVIIMKLTQYTRPRNLLSNKRFSEIMDEFFNEAIHNGNSSFVPGIDISETEDQFLITAEIPGIEKENIDITLNNGRLTISGERSFSEEEEDKKFHRVETKFGSFRRAFHLPENIDEDSIDASYNNGLLDISINKIEANKNKKIEIS